MKPATAAERRQRAAALAASLGAHALAASALALAPGLSHPPGPTEPAPPRLLQVVWVDTGVSAVPVAARPLPAAAPSAAVPPPRPRPRPSPQATAGPPAAALASSVAAARPAPAPPPEAGARAPPLAPATPAAVEPDAAPATIALAAAPAAAAPAAAAPSTGSAPPAPPATGGPAGSAGAQAATGHAALATAALSASAARTAGDGPAGLRRVSADHAACPPARYPALLRERGIEGVVQLRVKVGADGRATEVQVQRGSGWRLLDEAALAQARGCQFRPAVEGERPVAEWVEFPVRFALGG